MLTLTVVLGVKVGVLVAENHEITVYIEKNSEPLYLLGATMNI